MNFRPTAFIFKLEILFLGVLLSNFASAKDFQHAAMARVAQLYIAPDTGSAKIGEVGRGRELIVLEVSGPWVSVTANVTEEQTITGWMKDKGVVRSSTPDGDKILFGEAVDSEDQGGQRHGRHGAAQDAMRLYHSIYELFPTSPIAGEALYRAADIRWQIEKADVSTRPSAKEQDPYLREGMDEQWMKEVIKKFPGTKWADLAAFHLLDNKLCGDWQGQAKCPAKEADLYEKYANDHAQSPALAEALYDAAWRWAALIEIYKTDEDLKKSEDAKAKAIALGQKVIALNPPGDWGTRATRLVYLVQQGVPTYGNAVD